MARACVRHVMMRSRKHENHSGVLAITMKLEGTKQTVSTRKELLPSGPMECTCVVRGKFWSDCHNTMASVNERKERSESVIKESDEEEEDWTWTKMPCSCKSFSSRNCDVGDPRLILALRPPPSTRNDMPLSSFFFASAEFFVLLNQRAASWHRQSEGREERGEGCRSDVVHARTTRRTRRTTL